MLKRRRPPLRGSETGVVLINVLVILALTAAVVYAMISVSELSISRSQRFSDAAQVRALLAAGEASAIVALRRDLAQDPDSDYPGEAWGATGQEPVTIEAGTFALRIEDAQARYNLNSLPGSGVSGVQILRRIVTALDLPPDLMPRIAARLAQPMPLERLVDLQPEAGLSAAEVATLAALVTVLPLRTPVNINSAPDALLAALADNPVQAAQLTGIRSRNGVITPADATAAGVIIPPGAGYSSRFFTVTVTVRVGTVTQSEQALLQRRAGPGGAPEVAVVARSRATVPLF